jgi:hypothetical protein
MSPILYGESSSHDSVRHMKGGIGIVSVESSAKIYTTHSNYLLSSSFHLLSIAAMRVLS